MRENRRLHLFVVRQIANDSVPFGPSSAVLTDKEQFSSAHDLRPSFQFVEFGFISSEPRVIQRVIAPELIRKEKATKRSDIYSLGVTCYLMFTGKLPYEVFSLQQLYSCHLHVDPEHPSRVNPKCPPQLGDIIMYMMSKKPAKRPESFDQIRIKIADIGRSRI